MSVVEANNEGFPRYCKDIWRSQKYFHYIKSCLMSLECQFIRKYRRLSCLKAAFFWKASRCGQENGVRI